MKVNITRQNLSIYINESSKNNLKQQKEFYLFGDILVLVKDQVPHFIDLGECLNIIEKVIPKHLVYGLDSIFIGDFPEFKKQQINAFYRDGAIYVSNDLETDEDFIDDVIHEIAHLIESNYGSLIYEDQEIAREFLGKRQRLFYLLREEGYKVDPKDFLNIDYSYEFDMFLLNDVGYPLLTQLTVGLFLSPYGITSLREYFAESFECYFMRDPAAVKNISPMCYEKIKKLLELDDE